MDILKLNRLMKFKSASEILGQGTKEHQLSFNFVFTQKTKSRLEFNFKKIFRNTLIGLSAIVFAAPVFAVSNITTIQNSTSTSVPEIRAGDSSINIKLSLDEIAKFSKKLSRSAKVAMKIKKEFQNYNVEIVSPSKIILTYDKQNINLNGISLPEIKVGDGLGDFKPNSSILKSKNINNEFPATILAPHNYDSSINKSFNNLFSSVSNLEFSLSDQDTSVHLDKQIINANASYAFNLALNEINPEIFIALQATKINAMLKANVMINASMLKELIEIKTLLANQK